MSKEHGGARLGAGRKKKPVDPLSVKARDPLKFLLGVMQDEAADPRLRVRAAIAAAQYVHVKRADGGKKEEREAGAKEAGKGKFAPAGAPKLSVVKAA